MMGLGLEGHGGIRIVNLGFGMAGEASPSLSLSDKGWPDMVRQGKADGM